MTLRGRRPSGKIPAVGKFESHVNEVNKMLREGILKNEINAAKILVKKLKAAVGDEWAEGTGPREGEPPAKRSGDLQKGIGFAYDKHAQDIETQVGFHRPAYHAHLPEFGTDTRYQKSYKGKPLKKLKFVGHVAPHPFFVKTIMANLGMVKEALSEPVM